MRPPPEGWTWVTSVPEVIDHLISGEVEAISLDNDLGPFIDEGAKVLDFMAENNIWPDMIVLHSANNVAVATMRADINASGLYSRPVPIEYRVTVPQNYKEIATIPADVNPFSPGQRVLFPGLMFNKLTQPR